MLQPGLEQVYFQYLPMVQKIAREIDNGDAYLEKIASGRIGLTVCFERHDHTDRSFKHYAKMFITHGIMSQFHMRSKFE